MELDSELQKFEKKAGRYLKALRLAPSARLLEVVPIAAVLGRLLRDSVQDATICDVMAGSGYLGQWLKSLDYRVLGVEACHSMSEGAPEDLLCNAIECAEQIPQALKDVRCNIAVSLASFHHLIVTDSVGTANRDASLARQVGLVKRCFQECPQLNHFLIVDVAEDKMPAKPEGWPWDDAQQAGWRCILSQSPLESSISSICSASDYDSYVTQIMGDVDSKPASWFRDTVDPHSITGHQDAFLSSAFAVRMSEMGYPTHAVSFPAPWVFSCASLFEQFLWDKFAFQEDVPSFGLAEALRAADEVLGVRTLDNGVVVLGWKLAYILVSRC